MKNSNTLESRMKFYEKEYSTRIITDFIVVRVDGKSFSTLTNNSFLNNNITEAINYAAYYTALEMQNCLVFYPCFDECSFLLCAKKENNTQHWFGGKINKINSITSSYFTYYFNKYLKNSEKLNMVPVFDCHCFGIPDDKPEEFINYFVWRIKNAYRNALNRFVYFYKPEISEKGIVKQKEIEQYLETNNSYQFVFPYTNIWFKIQDKKYFLKRSIDPKNQIFKQLEKLFNEYKIVEERSK